MAIVFCFVIIFHGDCSDKVLEELRLGLDEWCFDGKEGVAAFPKGRTAFNSLNLLLQRVPQPGPLEKNCCLPLRQGQLEGRAQDIAPT